MCTAWWWGCYGGVDCLVSSNWCLHNCHKGLQGCSSGEPHKYGQHSRYCVIVTTTSIISPPHCTMHHTTTYNLHFLDWHHCHCCFEEWISQQSSEHKNGNGTLTWQFPVLVQLLTQNIDNPSKCQLQDFCINNEAAFLLRLLCIIDVTYLWASLCFCLSLIKIYYAIVNTLVNYFSIFSKKLTILDWQLFLVVVWMLYECCSGQIYLNPWMV